MQINRQLGVLTEGFNKKVLNTLSVHKLLFMEC